MSTVPKSSWPEDQLPPPMRTLHERIDEVRRKHPDFGSSIREIAEELPLSRTRRDLLRLAAALDDDQPSTMLATTFPKLRWLLTVPSSSATTDVLTVMLEQSTYDNALQQRRVAKAAYPVCLASIGIVVILFVCAFIVPTFQEMYDDFGLSLPVPTKALFSLADFVNGHLIITLVIAMAVSGCFAALLWAWICEGPLKRALIGYSPSSSQTKFSIAGAAHQLAELADDDIPIDRSLRIAAESSTEPTLRAALGDLANHTRIDADKISHSRASIYLPPNFLLALGNGSNRSAAINAPLMRAIARSNRDLSVHRKDWTSFLLGPIAFFLIGIMIMFVVISLFSPMLSLITSLSY